MRTAPAPAKRDGLVELLCERPWALDRATLVMLSDLMASGHALDLAEMRARLQGEDRAGAGTTAGPVAILPVYGVIDQHPTWLSILFGGTSVDELRANLRAAMADPAVRAVVLDVNSPGGSVAGITELAAEMRAMRGGEKPIVAVANGMAASAAYWLAAQADEVVVTPSGRVGSVGVYTIHQEISRLLDAMGVTTTIISAGEHKVEGNEFEPLTAEALAAAQGDVDTFYAMFVNDVARGRRVSVSVVEGSYGQGRAPLAREALRAGMVDRVDTLENTVVRLAGRSGSGRTRALGWTSQFALAIPPHKSQTTDAAWDAAANEEHLPDPAPLDSAKAAYAWLDEDDVTDANEVPQDACQFLHHEVADDGAPGSANLAACTAGIGVLNDPSGDSTIPADERQGVYDHLAAHLRDADQEPPALTGLAPFADRTVALATEAEALVIHATERARLRGKEGRPAFSTRTEAALRTTRAALDALLGADDPQPSDPSPVPAVQPPVPAAPTKPPAALAPAPPRFRSTASWLQYLEENR